MAYQRGFLHAQRVQQGDNGVGGLFYCLWRVTGAFAVAGQVDGQHVVAMVGKVAALQNPDAVVVERAVNKNHGRAFGRKGLAPGVSVQIGVVDGNEHVRILVKQRNRPIVPKSKARIVVVAPAPYCTPRIATTQPRPQRNNGQLKRQPRPS